MPNNKRIGPKQRAEIIDQCNKMIDNGMAKKNIIEAITEKYGFHSTQSCAMTLTKFGIEWIEKFHYRKPVCGLTSSQNNIDLSRHPHRKVALIIDEMPGRTAEFKEGQIYIDGKKAHTPSAYALAGMTWPPRS